MIIGLWIRLSIRHGIMIYSLGIDSWFYIQICCMSPQLGMNSQKKTKLNASWICYCKTFGMHFMLGRIYHGKMVVESGSGKFVENSRCINRMYNPNKQEKYHIKTFRLCDSITGYAYNLLICFRKETLYQQDYKVVSQGKSLNIFVNSYYTTRHLIFYLSSKKTFYSGTLMTNRKSFPIQI